MAYTSRLEEAFAFAAERHRLQVRKGSGAPYLTHLMAVAAAVGEHGGTEDQVIAALLHDVVEDQGVTERELAERFGAAVAAIVMACTDAVTRPKGPWQERKERHVARLRGEGAEVRLVVAADKLHNVRSILTDFRAKGVAVWGVFGAPPEKTVWYYRAVADALGDAWAHPLLDELREAVAALERLPRR